jgi:hypothetical protein
MQPTERSSWSKAPSQFIQTIADGLPGEGVRGQIPGTDLARVYWPTCSLPDDLRQALDAINSIS